MPYRYKRYCPICWKPDLLSLSNHLSQVHHLNSVNRKPYLQAAVLSNTSSDSLMSQPYYNMIQPPRLPRHSSVRPSPLSSVKDKEGIPYSEFRIKHTFFMLVVGPSQCGKTYFVQQMLTEHPIQFPNRKRIRITWYFNQWQPCYESLQETLGDSIQFYQGLPNLSDDLHEINSEWNTILVFDDLMIQAMDSPVLSRLFTQGRHRNVSVILLLQNMFPKGKYNTDISRNAQYLVLFRSPSDRKQIDIMAGRIFAKDRPNFMSVYNKVTSQPYGYVLIDNQPQTHSQHQVVSHIFETCQCYPSVSSQETVHLREDKVTGKQQPRIKKQVTKKVKTKHQPKVKKQVKRNVGQSSDEYWNSCMDNSYHLYDI